MHFDIQVSKNLCYEDGSQSQPRYFFEVDLSAVLPARGAPRIYPFSGGHRRRGGHHLPR